MTTSRYFGVAKEDGWFYWPSMKGLGPLVVLLPGPRQGGGWSAKGGRLMICTHKGEEGVLLPKPASDVGFLRALLCILDVDHDDTW